MRERERENTEVAQEKRKVNRQPPVVNVMLPLEDKEPSDIIMNVVFNQKC